MHTDPELLSLLALGERVGTDDDRLHVQTCPTCADEISELQRLVTMVRDVGPDSELALPDPSVWDRIREEIALPPAVEALTAETPALEPQSLLAVVAAALGGPSRGAAAVVAHATLASVQAAPSASGEAVIATDELGRRILQVVLETPPTTPGMRHAWLVHREDPALKQPLGILDGRYGVWTVDRSIDLEQYAIVDISQQGVSETEHSGQTLVRGELTLVS